MKDAVKHVSALGQKEKTNGVPLPVAVIDVGSSAIRMEIAEIDETGNVRSLEELQHPVHLGKDTFTSGCIAASTVEECVDVLQGFRKVLADYGITQPAQIRAVATSSVREAANRDTFLNRILIATHLEVELLDEAEVNRLAYIAVRDSFDKLEGLAERDTLVVEVGSGTTEVLLVEEGHVTLSHTYRLGALRMRETLEAHHTPTNRMNSILKRHIQRTIDQMQRAIPPEPIERMIALGGDVRFAVEQLEPTRKQQRLIPVDIARFSRFAREVAGQRIEPLAHTYHLAFDEAETVGPALLAYAKLAESFAVKELLISPITLRDGLLLEMASRGVWTDHFREQVVHSSIQLGHRYQFEEKHARHVAELSGLLFQALAPEHDLPPRYELLLRVAALLHETGQYVGNRSHHKHSYYLIANSNLFGLSRRDTEIVALVARYHRRAAPKLSHPEYAVLPRADRLLVSKLAAVLRVADALDQNHMQQIREIAFERGRGRLVLRVRGVEDLTLERLSLQQKGALFTEIFGRSIELRRDATRRGMQHVR